MLVYHPKLNRLGGGKWGEQRSDCGYFGLGSLRLSLWWDWAHQHKPKGYFALRRPAQFGGGPPTLQGGICTNGITGAFSNAALASQALSDVTQASSDQSTNTAVEAISARRRIEEVQQQAPPSAPRERKLPPREPSRTPEKTEQLIYKAPIAPAPYEPHWGVWAEGFGDYDRLTGPGGQAISCAGIGASPTGCPVGAPIPMNFNFTTKATTFGFVGGVDRTYRNFGDGGGTLIAGILTGYLSSDLKSSVTSTPATAAAATHVGTGFGTLSWSPNGTVAWGLCNVFPQWVLDRSDAESRFPSP